MDWIDKNSDDILYSVIDAREDGRKFYIVSTNGVTADVNNGKLSFKRIDGISNSIALKDSDMINFASANIALMDNPTLLTPEEFADFNASANKEEFLLKHNEANGRERVSPELITKVFAECAQSRIKTDVSVFQIAKAWRMNSTNIINNAEKT